MTNAGFADVDDPASLADTLSRDLPDRESMPLDGHPGTRAWEAVVSGERKAARADARCRRRIYNRAMISLGPDLDRFEADHAADLATVRQRWAAILAPASANRELRGG
jgi:hypothetical protein